MNGISEDVDTMPRSRLLTLLMESPQQNFFRKRCSLLGDPWRDCMIPPTISTYPDVAGSTGMDTTKQKDGLKTVKLLTFIFY